jgi:hypothetical protein
MYNSRPTFFIKKNSTLPKLKFALSEYMLSRYDITDDMLENCAVTFSMQDSETGNYFIANKAADLIVNDNFAENPDDDKYNLVYKFSLSDTSKAGYYLGEFKVDFLGENQCGKITFPTTDKIQIIIQDSSTKTTVI